MHAGEGPARDAVVFHLGTADILGTLFIQLRNRDCVEGGLIVSSFLTFFLIWGFFIYKCYRKEKYSSFLNITSTESFPW